MKFFLTIATLLWLFGTAHAQTTIRVTVSGQQYDLTYNTSTDFDTVQASWGVGSEPRWWNSKDFNPSAWATGLNNANNSLNDIRFAYDEQTFGGTDYALYYDYTNGSTNAASTATSKYAISARIVPAPLPILGILPIIGFLKKMRKRQTLS